MDKMNRESAGQFLEGKFKRQKFRDKNNRNKSSSRKPDYSIVKNNESFRER